MKNVTDFLKRSLSPQPFPHNIAKIIYHKTAIWWDYCANMVSNLPKPYSGGGGSGGGGSGGDYYTTIL